MAMTLQEVTTASFETGIDYARGLDEIDPLAGFRSRFEIPAGPEGVDGAYLCGNSLGLMPRRTRELITQELDDWSGLAVEGHRGARRPWYSYHELFRESGARLVGARPGEVVMMNSLTVNLHLLMVSFYRPEGRRRKILIEDGAFPSDTYAVKTHLRARGVDPEDALVLCSPRKGEEVLRIDDVESQIEELGEELALVMFGGVHFRTGQLHDLRRITHAAHEVGAKAGFDLAHAAGNVQLRLHEWNVDFACWCSYKYLNAGPGALAGAYVHERHGENPSIPRFAGWWGNDPDTRFQMQLIPEFIPQKGAGGWQLSNPPILAAAPLLASLELFEEAGMEALCMKSRLLTGYLEYLLRESMPESCSVITPASTAERGCQLSIHVTDHPRRRFDALMKHGIVRDFREPDVIRLAPTPLYNRFADVHAAASVLGAG